jgi:hypothetical protein
MLKEQLEKDLIISKSKKRVPFTKEQLEYELFTLGLTTGQIATKYGYNSCTIRKDLKAVGINLRHDTSYMTKELLEYEMLEMGLSIGQLAVKYNSCYDTITKYIKKFDINRSRSVSRNKSQKARLLTLKQVEFTPIQRSVIIGSILGDGCIRKLKKGTNAYLTCGQCKERKEYLEWKAQILDPFALKITEMTDGNFMFDTICYEKFNEFIALFKIGDRKIIPTTISNYLDLLTLAVWYQDDAHTTRYSSVISTNSFTKDECIILLDAIKTNFNINGSIKINDGIYPQLYFKGKDNKDLHNLIDPLFHSCFEYKKLENCS